MSTEIFTGKAEAYASARPGYPGGAIDYICSLVPPDAVIIDVGAGTGKFTLPLAERGYSVFAVEPNADMREKLAETLSAHPNAKIINGSAEATTLPGACADIITCAQALHWLDLDAFWEECRRIGKPGALVVAVYNVSPGGNSGEVSGKSTDAFFTNPTVREFPNPISYTRESWLQYMTSHSHDPLPSAPGYAAHIAEANAVFDRESVNGRIRRDVVTKVYSERIAEITGKAEIEKLMAERFGHDTLLSLATADSGRPSVRIVNSYYENCSFYTVTYALSNKMKQIEKNPEVAVCGEWFTAHGVGENLGHVLAPENAELMATLRAAFAEWYGNGHTDENDPHTCLLRVRLTDGVLHSNGTRYDIDFTDA